jgi:hypothetical protein
MYILLFLLFYYFASNESPMAATAILLICFARPFLSKNEKN